ncbi:nitroreductase [Flavivirga aquimarina]|uniref:Nitroreductase n=1 Tax=Flavivirga aquimarina TaxID=2027862 RepID=A0ABT8WC46_9FLAO|nr:nitroreductase [Flavivirga aquimarina]MDO5970716.1 nitroreductase [Flavivirga aquimarina]
MRNNKSQSTLCPSNEKEQNTITTIIRKRRSIFADAFIKKEIPKNTLEEILTNATWAPTHKMTEPWRFIVFKEKYLKKLGYYMSEYYKDYYAEKLSKDEAVKKHHFLLEYPLNAACVIGLILVRNSKINLPEWEEIAAISSAVQNMALTCTAHNLGSYWSTSQGDIDYVKTMGLKDNEKSLGLFYIGHFDHVNHISKKKRTALYKKVTWLT